MELISTCSSLPLYLLPTFKCVNWLAALTLCQVPLIQFIQEHREGEGHIEGGDRHPPERMEQSQASQIESTTPYPVEGASLHPSAHQNEDLTDHVSTSAFHITYSIRSI